MSSCSASYFINILSDKNKKYRILTIWNDEYNFDLILIDEFIAYKSNVTENALKRLAEKCKINFQTYMKDLRDCLNTNNLQNIIYSKNDEKLTISRKKGKLCIQFIDFPLSKTDFNSAINIVLNEVSKTAQFYENETLKLTKEVKNLTEEKNLIIQELEEFTNKKKEFEHELYSKFILVLNEKKLRIQYLQQLLEKQSTANGGIKEMLSDSDSSENESVQITEHNVQIECNESTPKKKSTLLDDDLLAIKSLPKRAKIIQSESPESLEKISTVEEDINVGNNKEDEQTNPKDSQNSLNFNTQDLFDRL